MDCTLSSYLATHTVGGCGLCEYILYLIAHLARAANQTIVFARKV